MFPLGRPNFGLDQRRHPARLEIAEVVSSSDPGRLFGNLVPRLRNVVPFDFVNFALCDPARQIMKMHVWEGGPWPHEPLEVAVEESAVGWVWRNQTVLAIDDLLGEGRFEPGLRWLHERELRSYYVFPLTTFQEKLGALGFGSKRAHAFSSHDIQFLRRVAEMVALCVDETEAKTSLVEEKARLRLVLDVGEAFAKTSDLEESVASILGSMQKWAVQDYVGIYLYDEITQSLRLHMTDSQLAGKMAPRGLTPIDGTLAGQAFRSQRSLVLDQSRHGAWGQVAVFGSSAFQEGPVGSAKGGAPRRSPILPTRRRTAGTGGGDGCARD